MPRLSRGRGFATQIVKLAMLAIYRGTWRQHSLLPRYLTYILAVTREETTRLEHRGEEKKNIYCSTIQVLTTEKAPVTYGLTEHVHVDHVVDTGLCEPSSHFAVPGSP